VAEPSSTPSSGPGRYAGRIVVAAMLFGSFFLAGVAHFATGGKSIAEVWYQWNANSLVGLQSLVEKRLDPNPEDPTLYFDVVLPILELPFGLAVLVVLLLLDIVPLLVILRQIRRGQSALVGALNAASGHTESGGPSVIRKE